MAINTPLGNTLDSTIDNLLAGKSALSHWKFTDTSVMYSKIGADLSAYDVRAHLARLAGAVAPDVYKRLVKLINKAPFSTKLTLLCAADAYITARLNEVSDPTRIGVIVAGHNLNNNYSHLNSLQFAEEPEFIDPWFGLIGLDTDHAASVSEAFGLLGPIYTLGGACASGNIALRQAYDEICYHDIDAVLVVGPVLDYAPRDLHSLALMGAISYQNFLDEPCRASRPFDTAREGFVPAHGAGVMVLESYEHARQRNAHIDAELLGVAACSDGSHLPLPSIAGQVRAMTQVLKISHVRPEEIDYISAHATSTPQGDAMEIQAIKQVFSDHAPKLKINATKSMLGHCCWSAPVVESIAAILQMQRGVLHPSINIDNLDPAIDLDVCANQAVPLDVKTIMKNSFGFGGINCISIFRRFDG